jgi:outer membrane receptor for ferrienterochelin and colicins
LSKPFEAFDFQLNKIIDPNVYMSLRSAFTLMFLTAFVITTYSQLRTITGTVRDADTREPLPYATIQLTGTTLGASANLQGNFSIQVPHDSASVNHTLVASMVGYKPQRILIAASRNYYSFHLAQDVSTLNEVTVTSGTLKEVTKLDSPIPVEVYTPALFIKNPTPGIFESLAMVNGVQPQLNCNVCNTGDIHINGMEGPYTMVLIDGMPIVSSLATVYGLAGIPNSMVKQIEIVKGPASTLYGSEAVGGLINIITKDPITSPLLKADVFATSYGEFNADISTKWKTSRSSALLGINYFNFTNKIDINEDNFTDVTLQKRLSLFNKWSFARPDNRIASIGLRYIFENRWGGELQWEDEHRGSDDIYGESIYTNRFELIGNYQLPFSREKVLLDVSYNFHKQDSYYGITPYLANQHVWFNQLRWEKQAGKHSLLAGLPIRYTFYDDNTAGTANAQFENKPMHTILPGIFIQDEIAFTKTATLLTGLRYDYHSDHGNIFSPRVSLKVSPDNSSAIRASIGNGFRVVNLFTEDHTALTGAREVIIQNELKPERSWNANLNYTKQWIHKFGYINIDGSAFFTYFTNKIVGDFLTDPQLIIYDNLDGYAISKGFTLNTEFSFSNTFKVIAGGTLMDVYQLEESATGEQTKTPQLFAPVFSGTYSLSYTISKADLTIDFTGRVNGPMHLPVVPNDYRPAQSPWYTLANIQLTKVFSNGLEVYGGAKNIFNFIPDDPLLRPFDPFDKNITVNNPNGYTFDTSYNYAPIQGIRAFAGVRYTLR